MSEVKPVNVSGLLNWSALDDLTKFLVLQSVATSQVITQVLLFVSKDRAPPLLTADW